MTLTGMSACPGLIPGPEASLPFFTVSILRSIRPMATAAGSAGKPHKKRDRGLFTGHGSRRRSRSIRVLGLDEGERRAQQNVEVEQQRPVLDVVEVVLDAV